jgi:hypothetical protein
MVFERFRRSGAPPGRASCYGKLPFDREFLRLNLDSDEGRWLVGWVDAAHHLVAGAEAVADRPAREVRAVLTRNGGRTLTAALIRPSRDGGGRSYPIAVFSVAEGKRLREQWHLAPLAVEPIWELLAARVLGDGVIDREALAAAVDGAELTAPDATLAGERFEAAVRAPCPTPWSVLTGAEPARARELASTLAQIAEAHRHARNSEEGVALWLSLDTAPAGAGGLDGAMRTASWVRLFSAVAGVSKPWPGIVEVREAGRASALCILGREPDGADLAYLLAGVGGAAIDRLDEPWDSEPSSEPARRAVEAVLNPEAGCVADLWAGGE